MFPARYLRLFLVVSWLCFQQVIGQGSSAAGVNNVDSVSFIVVGISAQSVQPTVFPPDDPNKPEDWLKDGVDGQVGKMAIQGDQEAFTIGKKLRERYPQLFKSAFDPKEVRVVTTTDPASMLTAENVLAGLYSGQEWGSFDRKVFPSTRQSITTNNQLLQIYNLPNCPASQNLLSKIGSSDNAITKKFLDDNKDLIEHVRKSLNIGSDFSRLNIQQLREINDIGYAVIAAALLGLKTPDWVNKPPDGIERFDLLQGLAKLQDLIPRSCSLTDDCKRVMSGYWLGQILSSLQAKVERNRAIVPEDLRMILYVAPETTVRPLMRILNINVEDRNFLPTAGFIIEYRETAYPEVRFLLNFPQPLQPDFRRIELARLYNPCEVGGIFITWCPLAQVMEETSVWRVKDPKKLCQVDNLEPVIVRLFQQGSTASTITAKWNLAVAADAKDVSGYKLIIRPLNATAGAKAQEFQVGASVNQHEFRNLQANTPYIVEVSAVSASRITPPDIKSMNTGRTAVSLQNLRKTGGSLRSLAVAWALRNAANAARITGYELAITPKNNRGQRSQFRAAAGATSFTFENLDPGTEYEVEIVGIYDEGAKTEALIGAFATDRPLTTPPVVPTRAPPVYRITTRAPPVYRITTRAPPVHRITILRPVTAKPVTEYQDIRVISIDKLGGDGYSLHLGWAILPQFLGRVDEFLMWVTPLGEPGKEQMFNYDGNTFQRIITGLAPDTVYNITMRVSSGGQTYDAYTVWLRTDKLVVLTTKKATDGYNIGPWPTRPPRPRPTPRPFVHTPRPEPSYEIGPWPTNLPRITRRPRYNGYQTRKRTRYQPTPRPRYHAATRAILRPRGGGYNWPATTRAPSPVGYRSSGWDVEHNVVGQQTRLKIRTRNSQRRKGARASPRKSTRRPAGGSRRNSQRSRKNDQRSFSVGCRDRDPVWCPRWAQQGKCSQNPFYMKPHCQKSCNCCGCTPSQLIGVSYSQSCRDKDIECPFWANSGECSKNQRWMKLNCRASCHFC